MAKEVLKKITPLYIKGGIPMVREVKACHKIVKVVKNNQKFALVKVEKKAILRKLFHCSMKTKKL